MKAYPEAILATQLEENKKKYQELLLLIISDASFWEEVLRSHQARELFNIQRIPTATKDNITNFRRFVGSRPGSPFVTINEIQFEQIGGIIQEIIGKNEELSKLTSLLSMSKEMKTMLCLSCALGLAGVFALAAYLTLISSLIHPGLGAFVGFLSFIIAVGVATAVILSASDAAKKNNKQLTSQAGKSITEIKESGTEHKKIEPLVKLAKQAKNLKTYQDIKNTPNARLEGNPILRLPISMEKWRELFQAIFSNDTTTFKQLIAIDPRLLSLTPQSGIDRGLTKITDEHTHQVNLANHHRMPFTTHPYLLALELGHEDIADTYLEYAGLEKKENQNKTDLERLLSLGDLVDSGFINLTDTDRNNQNVLFFLAAAKLGDNKKERSKLLSHLLEESHDKTTNKQGKNLFHVATDTGIIKALLKHDLQSPYDKNRVFKDETALHLANDEITQLLLQSPGIEVFPEGCIMSPLALAISFEKTSKAMLLINHCLENNIKPLEHEKYLLRKALDIKAPTEIISGLLKLGFREADNELPLVQQLAAKNNIPLKEIKKAQYIQIFLKELTGKTTTMDVSPQYSLATLSALVSFNTRISGNRFRLIFGGRQLVNGSPKTLQDSKIKKESSLHLVLDLRGD